MTQASTYAIDMADVANADVAIRPDAVVTPVEHLPTLSRRAGVEVFIKLETRQPTGSFKVRGAINALTVHRRQALDSGVVTFSTGNHGRAMAWAAARRGIRCIVFLSEGVPTTRRDAVIALGAEVRVVGTSQDEAEAAANAFGTESGALLVSPVNHPAVIAGQATVGLELDRQMPDLGTVIIPLSGGGLAAGVSFYLRNRRPDVGLVAVTMEHGAAMHESLRAGRPIEVEETETLAESLRGGIGGAASLTFPIVRDHISETRLVSEAAITDALLFLRREEGLTVEGAAAAAVAPLLAWSAGPYRGPVIVLGTGDAITPECLAALEASR